MQSSLRGGSLVVAELLILVCVGRATQIRKQQGLMPQVPTTGGPGQSTCGMEGKAAGCANVDLGSCGNACCALEYSVNETPADVHASIQQFLMTGGTSKAYSYLQNASDPDNITSIQYYQYVLQGIHRSSARQYMDHLNFNIRKGLTNDTQIVAFSMSSIPGALSDLGQNYKTLTYMFSEIFGADVAPVILHGCGKNITSRRFLARSRAAGAGKRHQRGRRAQRSSDDDDDDDHRDRDEKDSREDEDDEEEEPEEEEENEESTCLQDTDSSVRDCHKVDLGSCGHACCVVDVKLDKHAEVVHKALRAFMSVGGDSHTYKRVKGHMPFHEHPSEEVGGAQLAAHDSMTYQYIMQANHTSAYNVTDRMNINVRASKDQSESIMRVFATSMSLGALSDEGQNFKTIMYMMRQLHIHDDDVKILYGCGRDSDSSATLGKWATFLLAMAIAFLSWPK